MKKWLSLLLAVMFVFTTAACTVDDEGGSAEEEVKEEEKKTEFAVGESAEVDGIKVTVNSTRVDEGIFGPEEDGSIYFVMDIKLENTTDESFNSSSMLDFTLKDGDGREQDLTFSANTNGTMDTEVDPGESAVGEIAFKVAPEGSLVLTYTADSFGGDKVKFIVR